MKKLLIVANVAKEHVNRFHLPFIREFSGRGWQVDVACVHDEDVPYCHRQYAMVYKRNVLSFSTIRGIFQLRKILKENHYDVIHCHTPTGGVVARVASMGLRHKPAVFYTSHGFHFYRGASWWSWFLFYPVEKCLSFFTDCLITINSEDEKLARTHFHAGMTRYIPGVGVDIAQFSQMDAEQRNRARRRVREELGLAADDIVLVYVAEIAAHKNQLSLLDMMKSLVEEYPKARLLLVGMEHDGGEVWRKAERLGLTSHVICTGWRRDIIDVLAASDYAVPVSKREGLGLNIIEAMAAKVPVIAYDNRGHRDIIQHGVNGYIVPNGDCKGMAATVSMLIKNPHKRRQIVDNAFFSLEKYDIAAVLNQLRSIYAETLSVRRR